MSDPTTMDGIADKAVEAPGRGAGASILGRIAATAGSLGASGLAGAGNMSCWQPLATRLKAPPGGTPRTQRRPVADRAEAETEGAATR